jgi:hypothetical protein
MAEQSSEEAAPAHLVLVQLGCLVRAESGSRVHDKPATSHVTVGLGASVCNHCASDTPASAAFR